MPRECCQPRLEAAGQGAQLPREHPVSAAGSWSERAMQELRSTASPASVAMGEPLRWCVHGGPGTGKAHSITLIKELFTTVLKWGMGVESQVVALHAVMADQLGWGTIHHVCGIPVNRRGDGNDEHLQRQQDIAKRVVQMRWLSIDEVSMVSAKLWVTWI